MKYCDFCHKEFNKNRVISEKFIVDDTNGDYSPLGVAIICSDCNKKWEKHYIEKKENDKLYQIPRPLKEGREKKGGINERPKRPRPKIKPAGQNPSKIKKEIINCKLTFEEKNPKSYLYFSSPAIERLRKMDGDYIKKINMIIFLKELLEDTDRIIKYTSDFLKENKKDKKYKLKLLSLRKYYLNARKSIVDRIKNYEKDK